MPHRSDRDREAPASDLVWEAATLRAYAEALLDDAARLTHRARQLRAAARTASKQLHERPPNRRAPRRSGQS
jgi:hypothetical protein